MPTLIPNHNAEQFQEKISQTLFGTPESFIQAYNSGIVNARNEEIAALAKDIVQSYSNLELKGGAFTFVAQSELQLSEMIKTLENWEIVLRLKRELNEQPDGDIESYFPNTKSPYLFLAEHNNDSITDTGGFEVTYKKIGKERLASSGEQLQNAIANVIGEDAVELSSDEEYYYVDSQRVMSIDDSFVNDMYESLP